MKHEKFIEIFNSEVVPALGCTEPIAVALASATSRKHLGEIPEKIEVFLSGNVMKNGVGVGIPGTGMVGLHIASALGVTGGDPSKELEVLNGVKKEAIEDAKKLVLDKLVSVTVKENVDKLYIEVICSKGENSARTLICGSHTNIVLAELNGNVIFQKTCGAFLKKEKGEHEEITEHHMTVEGIWNFIHEIPLKEIEYVLKGAEMNRTIGL